ncbi:hypothetical protein P152DRAFT_92698 [Eremomyces bilateralis CBS 781.70]|uniref:RRM domain-containing protein n=1 Tax=Eremomyces bilateralis CBS 781.70 TaxID=1392243 RepID=A0A6G1FY94_9PEZI|nr:uncharacterized protein P152DRAFT_92698 [Eremomyces bilateralis CBS 781.70]KAF1810661.1 hypothetical protein P152DRAFT_92698 [Eremomyces bilateralis CBS 781.70]
MTFSPPTNAPEFRSKTLSPVSPKPLHYPSPSNIPILEMQMDPAYQAELPHDAPQAAGNQPNIIQDAPQPGRPEGVETIHMSQVQGHANPAMDGTGLAVDNISNAFAGNGGDGVNSQSNSLIDQLAQQPTTSNVDATSEAVNPDTTTSTTQFPTPETGDSQPPQPTQTGESQEQPNKATSLPTTVESGGVDFQALLDNLTTPLPSQPEDPNVSATSISGENPSNGSQSSSSATIYSTLPPRPPPQDKPTTHPNYDPGDDIRSYHPHNQLPGSNPYRTQSGVPPIMTGSTPAVQPPAQLPAQMPQPSPITPGVQPPVEGPGSGDDEIPWTPEMQTDYDQFLQEERAYVSEGQWDKFPAGSRLFIGNLPTEKVNKKDIFAKFSRHGKLAQVSIKQAYGFVQFLDSESCWRSLQAEQGMLLRGRKMHLEISKPQKNTKKAEKRRSRSPDHGRGGRGRNVDRYVGDMNGGGGRRGRDDYRPGRSPSPRGYGRERDRYERYRRSRSRSPYGGRGDRGDYYGHPSSRDDDDLPPRRNPRDVPDVQILVLDNLDRGFIQYVEKGFIGAGIRVDTLIMSPRLSESAVVQRQIVEGVYAVCKLTRGSQASGKINLQVFDRSQGLDNVRFDEYANLEPTIGAALVTRAKQATPQPGYGSQYPPYGAPSAPYGMPPPSASIPPLPNSVPPTPSNVASLIGNLHGPDLQRFLSSYQQQQPGHAQSDATSLTPDLARILSTASTQPPAQPGAYPPRGTGQYPPYNPTGAPPQGAPGPAPGGQQPNVDELMAQLAQYRR